jgi:uncharacterized membrane protein HdeD (DUF308 family)
MKNFIKAVNWKRFLGIESWCFGILLFFYIVSPNKFPKNFYNVPLITIIFGMMVLISGALNYFIRKEGQDGKNN